MIFIIFVGLISVLVMLYVYEQFRTLRQRRMLKNLPTVKSYPLVGSAFEFGKNSVDYLRRLQEVINELGSIFYVWMGPTLYVVLSDAKDVEVILNSMTHLHKPSIYDFLKDWLGWGLITSPAQKWRTQRKVLTPAFHFKILETYMDVFAANTKIMMKLLDKEVGKEKFDIGPYIDKCTLDVICETAMATSIHAQLNEEAAFPKSLKVVSNAIIERAFKPWLFPDFAFKLSPLGRRFNKHLSHINNYVDNVIVQRKRELAHKKKNASLPEEDQKMENGFSSSKKMHVFMDLLLTYADDPSIQLSDQDIRDEVNTFMFAGHDTTSSTIGFAVYLLGKHPEVQERVFQEVNKVFGESGRDPTYQDLLSLKYTEQVIRETLRLYPAVPYVARKLHEDVKLPSGHTIPAGAEMTLMFFKIHRNPEVFPDPEKFNPDNFLPERMSGRYPFAHTPFSAGPRNCIGQKFAMLEIKATVARLVQTFRITTVAPEPVLASELILRSASGINVRLEKRN